MSRAALRRRTMARIAVGSLTLYFLWPHLVKGDGLWLLTVPAVSFWTAARFVRGYR